MKDVRIDEYIQENPASLLPYTRILSSKLVTFMNFLHQISCPLEFCWIQSMRIMQQAWLHSAYTKSLSIRSPGLGNGQHWKDGSLLLIPKKHRPCLTMVCERQCTHTQGGTWVSHTAGEGHSMARTFLQIDTGEKG